MKNEDNNYVFLWGLARPCSRDEWGLWCGSKNVVVNFMAFSTNPDNDNDDDDELITLKGSKTVSLPIKG